MDEPTRVSGQRVGSKSDDPFRFENDGWMQHVRSASMPAGLGRIGPYEIIEEVGRGGQGIVYRARQPNTKRQIALKRLVAGSFASATARRRFEREVEAVTALNHPNIVTVYGMEIVDGMPLLAMEWIEGQPIQKWALGPDGKPRDTTEILRMFLCVCDAMRHAHARGVIHRDLKPANILVTDHLASVDPLSDEAAKRTGGGTHSATSAQRDLGASPKILDFGLAKLVDPEHAAGPEVTLSDEFVGTPAYAAPEQVRLDHDAIDARTDVYSLGMVLFQMLTGQMPYEIKRDLMALIETIQRVEPYRPSSLDKRLDREIDTIVLKALAKEPSRRYQTVDGLAEDVRRYLAGDPILAHPPRAGYYIKKMLWRHRVPAAIAGAGILAVIASLIVATVYAIRAQRNLDLTYLDNQSLRGQGLLFTRTLRAIDRADAEGAPVQVVASLEAARKRVVEGFVGGDAALPSIDGGLANVYAALGQTERAESGYRAALAQLTRQQRPECTEFAEYESALAGVLHDRGDWREAERLLRDAWRIRIGIKGREHRDAAMTMNDLAVVLLDVDRLREARSLLEQALGIVGKLPTPYDRDLGILRLNLGRVLVRAGDTAAAQREIAAAVAAFRRLKFHRFEEYASALSMLASLEARAGRLVEAEALLQESHSVARECYGDWHPRVADTLLQLASVLAQRANWEDATHRCREALAIRRQVYGDDSAFTKAAQQALEQCDAMQAGANRSGTPATLPAD